MTPEQTVKLIKLLKEKREKLRLSINEVARRAEVDPGTAWRIEQGMIAKPRVESLIAIGRVLGINPIEMFTTVGWITGNDLPDVRTYLTTKFDGMPDAEVKDIEHYIDGAVYIHGHRERAQRTYRSVAADCRPEKAQHCPQCPCSPKEY